MCELQVEEPQIEVEVDLAKAQQYGLKPGDVRRSAATLLASEEVADLWTEGKIYDVRVIGVPQTRHSLESVRQLLIDTPDGEQIPLERRRRGGRRPNAESDSAPVPLALYRR